MVKKTQAHTAKSHSLRVRKTILLNICFLKTSLLFLNPNEELPLSLISPLLLLPP